MTEAEKDNDFMKMTQTKQARHTALPWRVRQSILRSNPQIEQDSDSHYQICATLDHKETDEANVAFIVRAVNSHEELLGALQQEVDALNIWICAPNIPDDVFDGMQISRDKIKAAIKKAHATGE